MRSTTCRPTLQWGRRLHESPTKATAAAVVCVTRFVAAGGMHRVPTCEVGMAAARWHGQEECGRAAESAESHCRNRREHERSAPWPFAKSKLKFLRRTLAQ